MRIVSYKRFRKRRMPERLRKRPLRKPRERSKKRRRRPRSKPLRLRRKLPASLKSKSRRRSKLRRSARRRKRNKLKLQMLEKPLLLKDLQMRLLARLLLESRHPLPSPPKRRRRRKTRRRSKLSHKLLNLKQSHSSNLQLRLHPLPRNLQRLQEKRSQRRIASKKTKHQLKWSTKRRQFPMKPKKTQ